MNIQIFGKNKCFDTKSAERFFKERKIKYQFINLSEKGLSAKELDNILISVKDIDSLFDSKSPLYDKFNVAYILRSVEDKKELLIENPMLLKSPIVRDCDSKCATVGNAVEVWSLWFKKSSIK